MTHAEFKEIKHVGIFVKMHCQYHYNLTKKTCVELTVAHITVSKENSKIRGQTQTKPSSLSQINSTK